MKILLINYSFLKMKGKRKLNSNITRRRPKCQVVEVGVDPTRRQCCPYRTWKSHIVFFFFFLMLNYSFLKRYPMPTNLFLEYLLFFFFFLPFMNNSWYLKVKINLHGITSMLGILNSAHLDWTVIKIDVIVTEFHWWIICNEFEF